MAKVRGRGSAEETLGALGRRIDRAFDPTRMGELQVQAALGRMEIKDRVRPLLDKLQIVLDDVRGSIDKVVEDEIRDPFDIEEDIRAAMADLRDEIDRAEELQ